MHPFTRHICCRTTADPPQREEGGIVEENTVMPTDDSPAKFLPLLPPFYVPVSSLPPFAQHSNTQRARAYHAKHLSQAPQRTTPPPPPPSQKALQPYPALPPSAPPLNQYCASQNLEGGAHARAWRAYPPPAAHTRPPHSPHSLTQLPPQTHVTVTCVPPLPPSRYVLVKTGTSPPPWLSQSDGA
ncbi:hypothetical protein B0I37DRAFT_125887 [Chaetomium sp. MPI-CAGE-AT-0009]|nr:hypothetical protein B0I37DRAFT_125887 [Chaetomium sp. MPI-CAGE-AT-0009]